MHALPLQTTKLGHDGKGPKAYVVKQTHFGYILVSLAFLCLIIGALVIDYKYERFQFSIKQDKLYKFKEHQKVNKLSAESKLMKISAVLQSHLRAEKKEESRLEVMKSRLGELQKGGREKIAKAIDDAAEKQTDINEVKKSVLAIYDQLMNGATEIVQHHVQQATKQAAASQATMKHIQSNIINELKQEIQDDALDERDNQHGMGHGAPPPAGSPHSHGSPVDVDSLDEEDKKRWSEAENSLNHMLEHLQVKVSHLGGIRMGSEKVTEWEHVLEQTNGGKIPYEEAEAKMKQLMSEPSHGPMKSIIDESLPTVDNFEMLLNEIKFLPQKKAMLNELGAWKQGQKSVHEVLLYIEEKMGTGELDPDWLVEAASPENEDEENWGESKRDPGHA